MTWRVAVLQGTVLLVLAKRGRRIINNMSQPEYVSDSHSREILERVAADFEAVRADLSRAVKRLGTDVKEANP